MALSLIVPDRGTTGAHVLERRSRAALWSVWRMSARRSMSPTAAKGQERTIGDTTRRVCSWGSSGRNRRESGHRNSKVRYRGQSRRTGNMAGESVVSQKRSFPSQQTVNVRTLKIMTLSRQMKRKSIVADRYSRRHMDQTLGEGQFLILF